MAEISDEELTRLQQQAARVEEMEAARARDQLRISMPWIPAPVIDQISGTPDQIQAFGKTLGEQIPQPQPPVQPQQSDPASGGQVPAATPAPPQQPAPTPQAALSVVPAVPVPSPPTGTALQQADVNEARRRELRAKVMDHRATVAEAEELGRLGALSAFSNHFADVNARRAS